jgi:Cu/Zn superoxide dismutase
MNCRIVAPAIALLTLAACLGLPPRPTSVKLFDTDNKLVGFVDLIEIKEGVRFRVHTKGMPGGVRGFNIHESPVCEPPAFTSAGDILRAPSGRRDTTIPGDLPDITVGSAEWADTTFDWGRVGLDRGEYGLFRNGGTSLVILEQADGGTAGNASGRRIACGIVKERPEER